MDFLAPNADDHFYVGLLAIDDQSPPCSQERTSHTKSSGDAFCAKAAGQLTCLQTPPELTGRIAVVRHSP